MWTIPIDSERERQRQRKRDRERDRDRHTDRQTQTDRDRETETERLGDGFRVAELTLCVVYVIWVIRCLGDSAYFQKQQLQLYVVQVWWLKRTLYISQCN